MRLLLRFVARVPKVLFEQRYFRLTIIVQSILHVFRESKESQKYLFFLKASQLIDNISNKENTINNHDQFPCYLINRDKDSSRLMRFEINAKKIGLKYSRFPAINALESGFDFNPYKNLISKKFYNKSSFPRGSLGCFLSHYHVWKLIQNDGHELACIFEDDAFVIASPKVIKKTIIPSDADIIFINHRSSDAYNDKNSFQILSSKGPYFVKAFDAVMKHYKNCNEVDGIGLDGYILTKSGADKITKMFERHGFMANTDWSIIINSFSTEEFHQFLRVSKKQNFTHLEHNINAYVLIPSLVMQRDAGSVIAMSNPQNLISYEDMFKISKE